MPPIPEPTSFRGYSLTRLFLNQLHAGPEFSNYAASFSVLSNTVPISVLTQLFLAWAFRDGLNNRLNNARLLGRVVQSPIKLTQD